MPVEVKELVIRAVVSSGGDSESEEQSSDGNEEIVATCVEQVLKILERKKER